MYQASLKLGDLDLQVEIGPQTSKNVLFKLFKNSDELLILVSLTLTFRLNWS